MTPNQWQDSVSTVECRMTDLIAQNEPGLGYDSVSVICNVYRPLTDM